MTNIPEPDSTSKMPGEELKSSVEPLPSVSDSENEADIFTRMLAHLHVATGIHKEDLSTLICGDHFNHQY